jgi:hypothetical protein
VLFLMVAVQPHGKAVCRLRPIEGVTIRELTGTAGAYHLIASARPFAHGRAKRLAEHGDSPRRFHTLAP